MTDIVERLRENSAEIVADTLPRWKNIDEDMDKAADEIEGLRQEVLEQARLLGMGGEREADLRGEIERLQILLKKEYERGWDDGHIAGREKGGYERLCKIAAAAKNLISVKGRHHAELAYKRLEESLK